MTIFIKRYPNRKLYDTARKEYITLEGIADLIRLGDEIRVVDNASGEDLTAVTLSQIVFELEKRQAGSYPASLLAGLVQSGGETLEAVRRTLTASLDLSRYIDEEIARRMDILVAENGILPEEGQRILGMLQIVGRRQPTMSLFEERIHKALVERGVPTRNDLSALNARIDELMRILDDMD